jgi:carboxymethylenebutenolidase
MVNRLAVAAVRSMRAGVSFYGPAPAPAEAAKVEAAMMIHLAGRDERVNGTALPWSEALRTAGKRVEAHVYPDVEHAFHNDTSAARYNKPAADLAWQRTIDFFKRHLA